MVKTRKHHHAKNHATKVPHEHTCHGLHEWYVGMFEKLGWMILAKRNGWNDKVMTYKNSIHRLEEAIQYKHNHTKDADRKADLKIMLENVQCLKEHVHHDFP
jgi:hypothetical protein